MAEYFVTFENGSSAYLAHHGVLGMKWGVWNSETKAKYGEGGSRPKKTEAEKAAAREQRNEARKKAALYAGALTGITLARSGNPVLAGLTFGAAYASRRVSGVLVDKGQPVLDRLIKNPDVRDAVRTGADVGMTIAGTFALREAGANAVADLFAGSHTSSYADHVPYTLNTINNGGALANNGPKPHDYSLAQPSSGHGIADQLANANIPENLKRSR